MTYNKIKEKDIWILGQENTYEANNEKLAPGIYSLTDFGNIFSPTIPGFTTLKSKDTLIHFTSGIVADAITKIEDFFSEKTMAAYKYLKIAHKVGMLLHGPPGTGKTCASFIIMENMVKKYNALALDCTNCQLAFVISTIKLIREKQDNPMVLFYDEFENMADNHAWLSFLDGNDSQDKLIFMGCTNFLKRIPKRIRNRKSRIKYLFEINALPMAVYEEYIKDKLPDEKQEFRSKFSYYAEEAGLTIDQFKHAIIDFYLEKTPMEVAIEAAKKFEDE